MTSLQNSLCYERGVREYISVTWILNPVGVMLSRAGGISYLKKPMKVAICVLSMTGHRVGDMLESSLTSMELPGIEIGARAADQLIDLIERDEKKKTSVKELRFEAKLVERESTGEDTRDIRKERGDDYQNRN